jgi:hypothetical protein
MIHTHLFPAMHKASQVFINNELVAIDRIVKEHGHQEEDATTWLASVQYNAQYDMAFDIINLQQSVEVLQSIELVPADFVLEQLWTNGEEETPLTTSTITTSTIAPTNPTSILSGC